MQLAWLLTEGGITMSSPDWAYCCLNFSGGLSLACCLSAVVSCGCLPFGNHSRASTRILKCNCSMTSDSWSSSILNNKILCKTATVYISLKYGGHCGFFSSFSLPCRSHFESKTHTVFAIYNNQGASSAGRLCIPGASSHNWVYLTFAKIGPLPWEPETAFQCFVLLCV